MKPGLMPWEFRGQITTYSLHWQVLSVGSIRSGLFQYSFELYGWCLAFIALMVSQISNSVIFVLFKSALEQSEE